LKQQYHTDYNHNEEDKPVGKAFRLDVGDLLPRPTHWTEQDFARLSFLADPSDETRHKLVQGLVVLNEYRDTLR
jgi:hypothetical protein